MKRLLYTALTALLATSAINSSRIYNTPGNAGWRDLEPGTLVDDDLRMSGDTVGFVVGNFSGNGVDTLYCIAVGCESFSGPSYGEENPYDNQMDTYRFSNSRTSLKDLYVTAHPWLNYIKVEDLDNDGRDELQFLQNNATSSWLCYGAYDYFNNNWMLLTRPVTFCTMTRDDDTSMRVFQKSSKNNTVVVYEDEYETPKTP